MSLDVTLTNERWAEVNGCWIIHEEHDVYEANITHNLTTMAAEAGLYEVLWHPEFGTRARQLIEPLRAGLTKLQAQPERFTPFNAPNGWGTYAQFVPFIRQYLAACEAHPDAVVSVSR
jgi:hypothetical protein